MSAYLSIFEFQFHLLGILAIVALVASAAFRSTFILRTMLISTGMWFAPAFYLLFIVSQEAFESEIVAGFFLEALILVIWLKLVSRLMRCVNDSRVHQIQQLTRWLKTAIAFQLGLTMYLLTQEGMGLFSTGSRIEYLEASRVNLYLTYAGLLVSGISVPVAAAIVSRKRSWDRWTTAFVGMAMVSSLIAGSKGSGLLLLTALLCYVHLPGPRAYFKVLRIPLFIGIVFISTTVVVVGDYLDLEPEEMASLMAARFFLANDGRALSIDLASQLDETGTSLMRESFRSYSSLFGSPPKNIPLGQLQYQKAFSTQGLSGANSSATALLIAYGTSVEKALFAIFIVLAALLIYHLACVQGGYLIIRLGIGATLLSLLTQDFLAFQVVLNLLLAAVFVGIAALTLRQGVVAGRQDRRALSSSLDSD